MQVGSNSSDITTRADLELLITTFYDKLRIDPLIGHYFQELDLVLHLPRVIEFWAFIALDESGYKGNMMDAHTKLRLQEQDFERWLYLFHETIEEHFSGERADMIKERSALIAMTMRLKLKS